mmetsp:Transcript_58376/g.101466  ORF Transcript_58376/g.101466 Transcript_58376/m.101466 type:complete len:209 (-) Transcript_58376:58-684(-)
MAGAMDALLTNAGSLLHGSWTHSRGGTITVSVDGEHLVINNPYTQTARIPLTTFVQSDGLRYFEHRGSLEGSVITWSNGVTWTKEDFARTAGDGSDGSAKMRFFIVRGKVQNVMFRQTLIRAMQKRGVQGGGTNHSADRARVDLTMSGERSQVEEIVQSLRDGRKLNSWGAQTTSLEELTTGMTLEQHQVSTANVDSFSWNPNVEMYI